MIFQTEELLKLGLGAVIETLPILEGVSEEPVCFKLKGRTGGGKGDGKSFEILTFEVWYFSIPIGEWAVKVDKTEHEKTEVTWMDVASAKEKRCR